jgi:hypothetical protein
LHHIEIPSFHSYLTNLLILLHLIDLWGECVLFNQRIIVLHDLLAINFIYIIIFLG